MRRELEKLLIPLAVFTTWLAMAGYHPALAVNKPPSQGGTLPPFELSVPEDADVRAYLGLSGGDHFSIPQIKARVVILEIFNMY